MRLKAVKLIRTPPSSIRKAAIIGIAGLVLAGVFSYGLLAGKYRYPPYGQISPIYQQFYDLKQFFVNKSPLSSEEAISAEEAGHRVRETRLRLIEKVSDSVADAIVAAYRPFNITLDSPIGYTVKNSVRSGDSIQVYIHTTETTSVAVYRLGRVKSKVGSFDNLPENRQSPSFSGLQGFDWGPTLTLDTGGYRSGYYLIELTGLDSGSKYQIPLIVTPRQAPSISFVSQTNTWDAYNNYGGLANYTDTRSDLWKDDENGKYNRALKSELPHIVHLPYARPYTYGPGNPETPLSVTFLPPLSIRDDTRAEDPFDGHLFRSEWPLVAFAEEHKLDYGVYTDRDLRADSPILESDVIVFNTHSEYWSRDMMDTLRRYLAHGGRVVFAGGNSIYREVKHTRYGMRVIRQFVPSYITTPSLGTSYTGDGFRTYASYKVVSPEHWVFDGTSTAIGDDIGVYSANQPGAGSKGEGGVGASGFETDKVNRYSDLYAESFQTLAVGTNKLGPAHMVFKETDSGGWIFNAASVAFTGALLHDPVIDRMMLNLLGAKIE